jgi:mono/diheme cytochrome c family protein/glucose/arabinose dehydrogenase
VNSSFIINGQNGKRSPAWNRLFSKKERLLHGIPYTSEYKQLICIFDMMNPLSHRAKIALGMPSAAGIITVLGIFLILTFLLAGCQNPTTKTNKPDSLALRKSLHEMPALGATEAIAKMHLEDGFQVKLVAAEPLIAAPVALSFDEKGRIWVVEMQDYMPDTLGTNENAPTGKVVILSDKNGDGIMDDSQVFLDSLVLPRAICLIGNGILVAEPPRLWFYTIKNDKPADKILVDSAYAEGGNVEHQPNGLFRAMDNWIYNAKSAKRYKKNGDRWLIGKTHFRGQWGITQDSYGRLYYNTNSENLLGDYFLPGLGAENIHQRNVAGFSEHIVRDNRVWPSIPTPGVNRGYEKDVLDDSLRLIDFTAACGPVLYTGDLFGKDYDGNAFVAEPAGNLIKRDLLITHGYVTTGKEAYAKKEFLASEDERFRPVNLYNGPDGALYIVDMYRGIIQHKTYLTTYLKNEIKQRALTKPLNCGRIYRVVPVNKPPANATFSGKPGDLVNLLRHPNGWVRNRSQQLLVDAKDKTVVPALRQLLKNTRDPIPLIHALWTLEGLHALTAADLLPLLQEGPGETGLQALSALHSIIDKSNYRQLLPILKDRITRDDTLAAPYIAFIAGDIAKTDPTTAHKILTDLVRKYPGNKYVADAIIGNLQDKEDAFYKEALSINPDTTIVFNRRLKKVIDDIQKTKSNSNLKMLAREYPKGATIFHTVCQTCHGPDGNGISSLAPPLNASNWVQGDKAKLIPIVLYGLTGPVTIAGKSYKAPEISGDMPGIGANKEYTDEDIAQVLSFIRNAWNNKAGKIDATDIGNIRKKFKDRQKPFTMEELNQRQ